MAFVFTKELSVFIMCGGFMTLRVCVLVVLWKLGKKLLKVWFVACLCGAIAQ